MSQGHEGLERQDWDQVQRPGQSVGRACVWACGGAQVLTLAVAPAAEGHPSDGHKESHGHSGHSSHNLHSGQQVCGKKRGFLRMLSRNWGTGLGAFVGNLWVQRSPSLGIPSFAVP